MKSINKQLITVCLYGCLITCGCVMGRLHYVSTYNNPETSALEHVQLECKIKDKSPCHSVMAAFESHGVHIVKSAPIKAKVTAMFGPATGGAIVGSAVGTSGSLVGSYGASVGLKSLGISLFSKKRLIGRSSVDAAPQAILLSDRVASLIVGCLMEQKKSRRCGNK